MSGAWMELLNQAAQTWGAALWRATVQGGLALGAVLLIGAAFPRLPARWRCWLWRLAYAKLVLALLWATPVDLPLLPAAPPPPATAAPTVVAGDASSVERALPTSDPARSPAAAPALAAEQGRVDPTAWLLLAWLAGALWCAGRLSTQIGRAWRLLHDRRRDESGRAAALLVELAERFRLARAPRLVVTEAVDGPALLNALAPVIVAPEELTRTCPERDLRLMLAHELAHVRRRDLLWNWLPAMAHGLFYFHPLLWLANREWRLAQETACDELALAATEAPAADYGQMLVALAARGRRAAQPGLATLGAGESKWTLKRRLTAMKQMNKLPARRSVALGAAMAAAGVAVLVPWRVTAAPDEVRPIPLRVVERVPVPALATTDAKPVLVAARAESPRERRERQALEAELAAVRAQRRRLEARERALLRARRGGSRDAERERLLSRSRELSASDRALSERLRAARARRGWKYYDEQGRLVAASAARERLGAVERLSDAEARRGRRPLTPEERREVERGLAEARRALEETERNLPEIMREVERSLGQSRAGQPDVSRIVAEAMETARRAMAEHERDLPRIMRDVERQIGPETQREISRAMEEAKRALAEHERDLPRLRRELEQESRRSDIPEADRKRHEEHLARARKALEEHERRLPEIRRHLEERLNSPEARQRRERSMRNAERALRDHQRRLPEIRRMMEQRLREVERRGPEHRQRLEEVQRMLRERLPEIRQRIEEGRRRLEEVEKRTKETDTARPAAEPAPKPETAPAPEAAPAVEEAEDKEDAKP